MKDIKNFIKESLSHEEIKMREEIRKLFNSLDDKAGDVSDALDNILNWNDDDENQILLDLDETKSIYKAIDNNKYWEEITKEVNSKRYEDEPKETINSVKKITKENDETLSKILLKTFDLSIKELKEIQKEK